MRLRCERLKGRGEVNVVYRVLYSEKFVVECSLILTSIENLTVFIECIDLNGVFNELLFVHGFVVSL